MLTLTLPFNININCHQYERTVLYDHIQKKFYCPQCQNTLSLNEYQILCSWCKILSITASCNEKSNILLLSSLNGNINAAVEFNRINKDSILIEKEILVFLHDIELRHKMLNGCQITDIDISIEDYVKQLNAWVAKLSNEIIKWAGEYYENSNSGK